jgi:hypothetical protein
MGEQAKGAAAAVSSAVAVLKDLVSLLRDLALFVLALLLVAFPMKLNSVLVQAGFEEGSVVGFKWKSSLASSDVTLKDAQQTISQLQEKNNELTKVLAEAKAKLSDVSLKAQITKLEQDNKQALNNTRQVQASVSNTIAANATLVERALTAIGGDQWGVVWGGDTKLADAQYEVDTIARQKSLPNPGIYFRQGSYRSVAVVGSKDEANDVLSRARLRRSDAYVVNMSSWCPNPVQKDGYFECARP